MALGLEGIRVIQTAAWRAAPMAGRLLADWGADVISVEHTIRAKQTAQGRIKHTVGRRHIQSDIDYLDQDLNRNKRNMTLNLSLEAGREIIYNSNQDDIDRRHIWSVPAAGGSPKPLTRGKGIEWSPAALVDGSTFAFLRSDARSPARPAIVMRGSEPRDLAPGAIPADFPTEDLVEPQQVIISGADGMQIHAQLFLPRDIRPGERRPADSAR